MIRFIDLPDSHPGRRILSGRTPLFAAPSEPRCSYTTYLPGSYDWDGRPGVLVAVHGTGRDVERTRDRFVELAEEQDLIVVAPLFPAGIDDPDDLHNYKFLEYHAIRFDLVLLRILDAVAQRWNARTGQVLLCGHSGGAQFAHRFWYLHPERVTAAAFSAPGRVTLVDDTTGWPSGTRDTATRFGVRVDPHALRHTPVHLVIGAEDHGEADLAATAAASPGQPGGTRLERLSALEENLRDHGVPISKTIVPDAGHDADATASAIARFFGELPILRSRPWYSKSRHSGTEDPLWPR
jgi:poly(3-hydroxybutyrate) depolymerase